MKILMAAMILVAAGAQAQASCRAEIGARKAAALVKRCIEVSPATHPPCNATNSCALIISEIKRSCALLGTDAPAYCAQYSDAK